MSNTNNKWPPEILMNIFHYMEASANAVQCRLVCKSWNPTATRAIYKKIVIKQEDNAARLLQQLQEKPERAQLIKQLDLSPILSTIRSPRATAIATCVDLFKASFTPQMEYLITEAYGEGCTPLLYDALFTIVEGSPGVDYGLKDISTYYQSYEKQAIVAYACRHTLETLSLDMRSPYLDSTLDKLGIFKCLKGLSLYYCSASKGVSYLESILENCPHLHHLELAYLQEDREVQDEAAIAQWTKEYVMPVASLTQLHPGDCLPDYAEYLTYKYPNIKQVSCEHYYNPGDIQPLMRFFRAVKNVDHVETYIYVTRQEIEPAILILCNYDAEPVEISVSMYLNRDVDDQSDAYLIATINNKEHRKMDLKLEVSRTVFRPDLESILNCFNTLDDHCTIVSFDNEFRHLLEPEEFFN